MPRQRALDMKVGLGLGELMDQFGGGHGGILKTPPAKS
jgi:hypothetical protein